MKELISVIMPVYNKAPHLERSIESVLNQKYSFFELIIIDDGSTDGSLEIIKDFDDNRIKIFERSTPGPGGYKARNLGIEMANGKWVAFIDADDRWDPNYLKVVSNAIFKFTRVEVISAMWYRIDENSVIEKRSIVQKYAKKYNEFYLNNFLRSQDLMWTGAVVVKLSLIREVGGFPITTLCRKGGDMDTWIRLLYKSELSVNISIPLAYYYKDTVNRVTNSQNNPTTYFCSYDTLMEIYRSNKEEEMRRAIRYFVNKNIYNILANHLNTYRLVDRKLWSKMFINLDGIIYSIKLSVRYLLLKLGLL